VWPPGTVCAVLSHTAVLSPTAVLRCRELAGGFPPRRLEGSGEEGQRSLSEAELLNAAILLRPC
jgi:hypothetical protein